MQPAVRVETPEIPVLQPTASWKEMAAAYGNLAAFLTQKWPELLDCVANAEVAAVAAERNAAEARAAATAAKGATDACALVVDALRRDVAALRSDLSVRTQNIPSSGEIRRVAADVAKDVAKDEVENTGRHIVTDVVKAQLEARRVTELERDNVELRERLRNKDEKTEAAVEKKKDFLRDLAKMLFKPALAVIGVRVIEMILRGHF